MSQSAVETPFEIDDIVIVTQEFFSGGARKLMTDIAELLHKRGKKVRVIGFRSSVNRGGMERIQRQEEDANYIRLNELGIPVSSLDVKHDEKIDFNGNIKRFSGDKNPADPLERCVRKLAIELGDAKLVVTVKEQVAQMLKLANKYRVEVLGKEAIPIAYTLHRSDPGKQDKKTFRVFKRIVHGVRKGDIAGYIGFGWGSAVLAYHRKLRLGKRELEMFRSVPLGMNREIYTYREEGKKQEDLDIIFTSKYTSKPPPAADHPIVLFNVRNNDKEKNIRLFLQSALLFLNDPKNNNAHVITCGSSMDEQSLNEMINKAAKKIGMSQQELKEVKERLHMLGKVSREQVAALARVSTITALTSPIKGETGSLALNEGLCGGSIPVTTNTGDASYTVGRANPKRYLLKRIRKGFIKGTRGILTSEKPKDIVAAWGYAIAHPEEFVPNIKAYQEEELSDKEMGENFIRAASELVALRKSRLEQPRPLRRAGPRGGHAVPSAPPRAHGPQPPNLVGRFRPRAQRGPDSPAGGAAPRAPGRGPLGRWGTRRNHGLSSRS
jgi:glycosyltransferase involved in cell wall biosynthesis